MNEVPVEVPLVVELGPQLRGLSGTPEGEEAERRIRLEVAILLSELGVPGLPSISISTAETRRVARFRVHGALQPYPPGLWADAWASSEPDANEALPVAPGPTDLMGGGGSSDRQLEPAAPRVTEDAHRRHRLVSFLERLCTDVLRRCPESLLGMEQVDRYLGGQPGHTNVWEDVSELLEMLRSLLRLGVAIGDRETILRHFREGRKRGISVEERVEAALSDLRPDHIEIVVGPALLLGESGIRPGQSVEPEEQWVRSVLSDWERAVRTLVEDENLVLPQLIWRLDAQAPSNAFAVKINHLRGPWRWAADFSDLLSVMQQEIRLRAESLISVDDVEYLIAVLEQQYWAPALIQAVLRRFSLGELARMVRGFLREGHMLMDLPGLLDRALRFDIVPADVSAELVFDERLVIPQERNVASIGWSDVMQFVRQVSKGTFGWLAADDVGHLKLVLVDHELELRAMATFGVVRRTEQTPALDEEEQEAVRDSLWSILGGRVLPGVALLTGSAGRLSMRELIASELPEVPVLAETELNRTLDRSVYGILSMPSSSGSPRIGDRILS